MYVYRHKYVRVVMKKNWQLIWLGMQRKYKKYRLPIFVRRQTASKMHHVIFKITVVTEMASQVFHVDISILMEMSRVDTRAPVNL